MAGYPVPDKEAALVILHHLLGREPYQAKARPAEPAAAADLGRRVAERVKKSRSRKRMGL
jgi:hypothetical protein